MVEAVVGPCFASSRDESNPPRMPDAPGTPIQVLRDRYVTTPRVSFWVNSRHWRQIRDVRCSPYERTCSASTSMSAGCQLRT